jgi:hypothetical protein
VCSTPCPFHVHLFCLQLTHHRLLREQKGGHVWFLYLSPVQGWCNNKTNKHLLISQSLKISSDLWRWYSEFRSFQPQLWDTYSHSDDHTVSASCKECRKGLCQPWVRSSHPLFHVTASLFMRVLWSQRVGIAICSLQATSKAHQLLRERIQLGRKTENVAIPVWD